MRNWLLPEYVEDILPTEALHIETLRRRIGDFLFVHGYQLVNPPLLEYIESLLSGSGSDMDLHMFKVIDQLSGRMMGLRADMTPQVARIDAHLLNCKGITRLCYASSVLHTVPSGLTRTREPLQIGAELYGHSGLESDIEIQRLMMECLSISGIKKVHLDLGHVAVFRGLIKNANIPSELETELFSILQAKDIAGLKTLCAELTQCVSKHILQALLLLPELYGDSKILILAHKFLPDYPEIRTALSELEIVGKDLRSVVDSIAFDLADLRGYHYHSGMVFSAYTKGCSNAIALGGRYDEIGKAFGRARPATGFSMDLRELSRLIKPDPYPKGIMAPNERNNQALEKIIRQLRDNGQIVIVVLQGQECNQSTLNCDRRLVSHNGDWVVETI
ncbi:MAG: ATP phosphoribosyltransferase regulatory subunit [Nitrosomonas sp.]|nr:ATP phosphoribosyltransferase regulatory subunit [Nitrosomonas sp.]MDP1949698.1 ATP phosphoribosyltransferase regulatory subunit [Nitrosomonas sp.]